MPELGLMQELGLELGLMQELGSELVLKLVAM